MGNKKNIWESGQSFVSLLLIAVIGITIATGATMLVIINSQSGLRLQQGTVAYAIAQSGAENALLRLLRDPTYSGETNMPVGDGTVDVEVSNSAGTYIATASSRLGNYVRKVQIMAHYNSDYVLVIDSRKEIF
jgi:hypothetical protein